MKKIIKLTESDLIKIVKKVVNESEGRFDYKNYLKFLKDRKKNLDGQLIDIKKELDTVNNQLKVLQGFLDPKVGISIGKMPNGTDRYMGRFMATFPDGTVKQVTVNLGPTIKFTGKDDPKLLELAKEKAIDRYSRINPEYLRNLFN